MSFNIFDKSKKLLEANKNLSEEQDRLDIKFSLTNYQTNRQSSKWIEEKSDNYCTLYSSVSRKFRTTSPRNKFASDFRKNFKELQKKTKLKLIKDRAYYTHNQFYNGKEKSKYVTIENFHNKSKEKNSNSKIYYNTSNKFLPNLNKQKKNQNTNLDKQEDNHTTRKFYKKLLKGKLLKIISHSIVLKRDEIESYVIKIYSNLLEKSKERLSSSNST